MRDFDENNITAAATDRFTRPPAHRVRTGIAQRNEKVLPAPPNKTVGTAGRPGLLVRLAPLVSLRPCVRRTITPTPAHAAGRG
jgi:hypothetical protein